MWPNAQLLTLHPGAFAAGDPSFENHAVVYGTRKGFRVTNLKYPLGDLDSILNFATFAAALIARRGPVYAYGDSAGATVAARLAEQGSVRAAACYSAVPNVWDFLTGPYGATWKAALHATKVQADRMAPALHRSARRIYLLTGNSDPIIRPPTVKAWDATDPLVISEIVPGAHLGDGPPNAAYLVTMRKGIDWLTKQP